MSPERYFVAIPLPSNIEEPRDYVEDEHMSSSNVIILSEIFPHKGCKESQNTHLFFDNCFRKPCRP